MLAELLPPGNLPMAVSKRQEIIGAAESRSGQGMYTRLTAAADVRWAGGCLYASGRPS